MIGGKIIKRQKYLILDIEQQFPDGINWINLVDFLAQLIDIVEIKYFNLNVNYIDELIFFYGAKQPNSTIKKDFIDFLLDSKLSHFVDIENTERFYIGLNGNVEELLNDKIINHKWVNKMEDLEKARIEIGRMLLTLENKLMKSTIPQVLIQKYPLLNSEIAMKSKYKSYNEMSEMISLLPENHTNLETIEEDLDRLRNNFFKTDKEFILLSDEKTTLWKKINRTRRGKLIPKYINKSPKQIKKNKKERFKLLKLVQHVITGFILKYKDKYTGLKRLFIDSIAEIPFDKVNNVGRGFPLTRLSFQNNTLSISPREAAQLELENIENKGKIYGDPGYISESDNRIQFSGLEPFSLKLLTNERDEVNWWLERLSTSTYPNLEEKQWIYQYYK